MGKLKTLISEILIVISSYFRSKRKIQQNIDKDKTVLISYANIFGDVVLLLDCVNEFDRLYPKQNGYEVTFICRPAIKKFLLTLHPSCSLHIETVDWVRFARDFSYYREVIKHYSDTYDKVIVPYDHTVTNDFFVRSIKAKEKIAQDYDIAHKKIALSYILGCSTYTKLITVNKNASVLERQRILINELGNGEFKSRMPYIQPLNCSKLAVPNAYAVMCPTASYPPKSWAIENFARVADYLAEKYDYKVCICGGNEDPEIFNRMSALVNEKTELVDFVAKTDFAQWAELMRGAKAAVCNDSASYHLAAAVRTPAVCIAGDFACVNAPLYKPDIVTSEDRIPLVVYKKMSCEGCRYIGYRYGYGNSECSKMIKNEGILQCVKMITVQNVIGAIEKQIGKYNVQPLVNEKSFE